MSQAEVWFLKKTVSGEVYGPTTLDDLRNWAVCAKISPMDRVSGDNQESWVRAPMIPELQMDWLVELEDDYLYGPTSIGTIVEFLEEGEIDESVMIINCKENVRTSIAKCPAFASQARRLQRTELEKAGEEEYEIDPIKLHATIRALREELAQTRNRCRKLESALFNQKDELPPLV
jgi:hypothetical protein